MERPTALLAAAMLVVAGLPAAAAVGSQPSGDGIQPGAQFAGAVAVQGAEVDGEIEGRTLDRRLAAADSNESRAGVVARESERASERLERLGERRSTLRERHENGSISESEYRARLAAVAAESRGLERRLNETAEVARSLPPAVAEARGVNASRLAALRADADALNDGEAAEAARAIAGDDAGNGLGGPPEDVGPPWETDAEDDDAEGAADGDSDADDERGPPEDPGAERGENGSESADGTENGTAEEDGDDRPGEGRGNGENDGDDDRGGTAAGNGNGSDDGAGGVGTDGNDSGGDAGDDGEDGGAGGENGGDDGEKGEAEGADAATAAPEGD
ncbi:DUF7096 domain-containing protein [Halorarum halobium]|uniref:DUF7096 domain-containing protein n=1 Tax=Halorarum halobium TaxID=3075121 RepID=UPI0028AAA8DF|nr:hypothetical protein [Halobaculum sp. XH14]